MKRRDFLHAAGAAIVASSTASAVFGRRTNDAMDRIGLTTVIFRMRFAQTRAKNHPAIGKDLALIQIPEYFADRFSVHNVECWSKHFESRSAGYLSDLKKALEKSRSTLINIQLDEPGYNLSEADAAKRRQSVDFVKGWMDVASQFGSSLRANTGRDKPQWESCVESLRELATYAEKKSIVLLVENHGGIASDPDQHARLIRTVDSKHLRTLPDYGNYSPEIRYDGLRTILPYAHLISAKTEPFNTSGEHDRYDFDKCMKLARDSGFTGVYSAEYWDPAAEPVDYEKIADWMIDHIREYL